MILRGVGEAGGGEDGGQKIERMDILVPRPCWSNTTSVATFKNLLMKNELDVSYAST